MSFPKLRRAVVLAACATSLLLSSCGSGTIESQFNATRVVAFGDGMADLGQTASSAAANARYTVNDGSVNIWTQELAASYGFVMAAVAVGGTSYATGNARINTKPDAAGSSATPTLKEQIDTYLAGSTPAETDLFILSGGTADVVAEVYKVGTGAQTADQAVANVRQAGRDLGAQVRRMVTAGATHVMVSGIFDLSKTPWGTKATTLTSVLADASARFNEELLVSIVDLGAKVLYVDAAFQYNLMIAVPANYALTNSTDPVCTATDPGPGIGIGAGELNSALCTATTITSGADFNAYVFADKVYPTPAAQRKFGDYAYVRIRGRW